MSAHCCLTLKMGFEFLFVFKGLGIDLCRTGCIPRIYRDDFVMGVSCLQVIQRIENQMHFWPCYVNIFISGSLVLH